MSLKKSIRLIILMIFSAIAILISGGCLSLLQPRSEIKQVFNFVDYDAPAMRLARPAKAYLLKKDVDGKWVEIGKGTIPAGAYIKGRKPVESEVK